MKVRGSGPAEQCKLKCVAPMEKKTGGVCEALREERENMIRAYVCIYEMPKEPLQIC